MHVSDGPISQKVTSLASGGSCQRCQGPWHRWQEPPEFASALPKCGCFSYCIISNIKEIGKITTVLKAVLRSMSTAQRRKWVSLLVKMLLDPVANLRKKPVIEKLKMLWLVEDNPGRTFAEAERQLRIFAKSSADVRREMVDLIG